MASSKKLVSAAAVQSHTTRDDCWIVVEGKVYNMTRFAPEHPGGAEIIYTYAGRDATEAYLEIHEPNLIKSNLLSEEQVGDLDPSTQLPDVPPGRDSRPKQKKGDKPSLDTFINLYDFEDAARKSLSEKSWTFISGASNDNITRDANHDLFRRIWFRPRVLRDVSTVSTKGTMMGCQVSLPIWIAPAGVGKTAGPEGELALSKGAAATGIIQTISTTASFPLLEILDAAGKDHPFFFQLYINKDRSKTEELLRVINSRPQIKALFVTVDLPVVSKREADERIKHDTLHSSGLGGASAGSDHKGSGLARSVGSFIDPAFCWDDLAWLRRQTQLPIVLKGIQSAADAKIAMHMGCQGIVVSNHGGRALDGAPASILVLLELHRECAEVFDHMEVFIDGGFRRGSDILKAICLGASGVGLGRPFMYAINYGKEGVMHVVNILKDEVETAMRLAGLKSLDEADPALVNTADLDTLVPRGSLHPYARRREGPRRQYRL
ncbi:L-lactate dehydrogenase (cytochrome) [Cladophialophora psammophila CBS 110553]|uniref:L-lactate dehydrogenase (cytochrome) n=1 Tax=Cladophialophora psammophila CBS 110553 TaxID=1182543 RepID=W9X0M5_9EURO|nr:L-lactate dehydrogenase (cytochrome) [Cladophialophora psammophila CBS 110553]EXJ70471.1 L-lactate dehydrogenase (cytochrome) [Cladophialophora psammophila CBS 110553]